MYAYIDESGNTGNHLFDEAQPVLYYGLLTCKKNLDFIAEPGLARLRLELGVDRIHASQLGIARLVPVARWLCDFQKKHDLRFDIYRVMKKDHVILSFFDQVFDSGMNDAVPHSWYFGPMRFLVLQEIAKLFDKDIAKKAWNTRLDQSPQRCAEELKQLCNQLCERAQGFPDARLREISTGAFKWAAKYPEKISYGASNQESALQISPNLVGFQQVLTGLAARSQKMNRDVRRIIVDRQNEFNTAQDWLADIYRKMKKVGPMPLMPGMPPIDWTHMPDTPLEFIAGDQSAGLEIVDVYLWLMKRVFENKQTSKEAQALLYGQRHRGRTDEVSLAGIEQRWRHLRHLSEPDSAAMAIARSIRKVEDEHRQKALEGL